MAGTRFTKEETKFILENFHNTTYKVLSEKTRRTQKSIKHLIRNCGIHKIDYPNGLPVNKLNEILLFKFPKKVLTDNEKFILNHFATMKVKDIAKKLNLRVTQVSHIAKEVLKLPSKKQAKNSQKDVNFVLKNYNKKSTKFIATYLGKTKVAVQLIANRHGLRTREFWSKSDILFIKNNYKELPLREIAAMLGRTVKSVNHVYAANNLSRKKDSTSIEIFIHDMLINNNIIFKEQFRVGRYVIDFLIDNLIIEAYGTFWHCDPRVYPKGPKYKRQKTQKQHNRRTKFLKSKGYDLLIVWEKDINERPEEVKTNIIAAIKKSSKNGES